MGPPRPPIGVLVLRGLCLVALGSVAWLLLGTLVAGLVTGWDRSVISSGSMEPSLLVGDVLLTDQPGDEPPGLGAVVAFRRERSLVSHRVVAQNEDGTLQTRGDANAIVDSDPVQPDQVMGVGRMVIPYVGLPQVWFAQGRWVALGLLVVGLGAAGWGAVALGADGAAAGRRWRRGEHHAPRPSRIRTLRPVGAIVVLLALILVVTDMQFGRASYAAETQNTASSWDAAASFCTAGPTTVTSVADTHVRQNSANSSFGTQTTMQVRSRNGNRNRRALVRFALPSAPSRCQLGTATLRLFASASSSGRTIQVQQASAAWTETVTWNTQPGVTGPIATSVSGTGWRTWNVSSLVAAQYLGTNRGFVLRDSAENAGSNQTQTYHSREGTNDPQLVLTWVPAP